MICARCGGSGFLNIEQVPETVALNGVDSVFAWMNDTAEHDVTPCNCCGNGEAYYGLPGQHYSAADPQGKNGPYASNGGLARCH